MPKNHGDAKRMMGSLGQAGISSCGSARPGWNLLTERDNTLDAQTGDLQQVIEGFRARIGGDLRNRF